MKTNLDPAINIFGAEILLKHLDALEKEFEGVSSGAEDIEFVHRMRVATRRLRAAIPLFPDSLPPKKSLPWLRHIRKITQALGAARDTDVQMEALTAFLSSHSDAQLKPGVERLLLRLRQQRQQIQPQVAAALQNFNASATLPQMKEALLLQTAAGETLYLYTTDLYQHAAKSILLRLDEFLAFDAIVSQPEKITELHQMRISAKHLRYTLENFQTLYNNALKPWLSAVRGAQDSLGSIHDCDVWGGLLPVFSQEEHQRTLDYFGHARPFHRLEPGIQAFLEDRQAERGKMYQSFNKDWITWAEEQVWQALRAAIQAPLLNAEAIFPPRPDEDPASSTP